MMIWVWQGQHCDYVDYCMCGMWDKNENFDYAEYGSWEIDYVWVVCW